MQTDRRTWFVPLDAEEADELDKAARQFRVARADLRVVKRSLDARKGHPIGHHLELAVGAAELPQRSADSTPRVRAGFSVVVVGAGPAGMYAADRLSRAGAQVTLVEQGRAVQPRRHDLAALTQRGALDPTSNYCFGEGGAGTFSDGKLYTRTKDRAGVRAVLETLVAYGADASILVDSRPHIGSNLLPKILVAMREDLLARGVVYRWETRVEDLLVDARGKVSGVATAQGETLSADAVVLAVGHSARGIYEMLHRRSVALVAKPFAVGARIEHPQTLIDRLQYGKAAGHPKLSAAFYQLATQAPSDGGGTRGVYSFCMCPGGWVVNSSTIEGELVTNGMSLSRRDAPRANAAMVVSVEPRDFGGDLGDPLAGLHFQRAIERRAFALGGGGFIAPAQKLEDFFAGRASSAVRETSYLPGIIAGDVAAALPPFVVAALKSGLRQFDRSLPGFSRAEAQLVGVETRTSSPVRIVRDDATYESPTHPGLYPTAEGAGYAGGIVSAALDGLRVAEAAISRGA